MTTIIDTTPDGIQVALQGVYDKVASDFREISYVDVLVETHRDLEKEHSGLFAGAKDPNGQSWQPLAASTLKRKKGRGSILVHTGRLRASLKSRTGDSIREVVDELGARNRGLSFGTRVPYSIFHQQGTAKIPQRAHVGVTRALLERLVRKVAAATVRKLKERAR